MGVRWRIPVEEQPYKDTKIPVAQFTAEGGYYFKILSDARKIVFVYAGASALAGYESVNWAKKVLHDGSTLHDRDAFIYGGALTLDVEFYVADRIALLANLRERCLWGGDTRKFHTQFGRGHQVHHQLTTGMERDGNRCHEADTPCGLPRTAGT